MRLKIEEQNPPVNEDEIEKFEKKFEIILPKDYKEFLLKYNGGMPEPNFFYCNENQGYNICNNEYKEDVIGILYFYSLNEIKMYKEDLRVPPEFLAIADDYGNSSRLCIGIHDKYHGKIYFWGYGDYMVAENKYSNIYYITDSFIKLLDGLEEDKE